MPLAIKNLDAPLGAEISGLDLSKPTYFANMFAAYEALPAELKNENPLGIWRLIDGECTKESS